MTKYIRKPEIVDAEPYEKGLEDGFEETIESLGKGIRGVRKASKPYIETQQGKALLEPGDYIVTNQEGNRSVVPGSEFNFYYKRAE